MIWKQCRKIRREPGCNKGIHLVISASFWVHLLMQFIRGRKFSGASYIYINLPCMHGAVFSSNHQEHRHNSPCNKTIQPRLMFCLTALKLRIKYIMREECFCYPLSAKI